MKFVTKLLFIINLVSIGIYQSKRLKESEYKSIIKASEIQTTTDDQTKIFQIDDTKNNSIINIMTNTTFHLDFHTNPILGYDIYLKNYDKIDKHTLELKNLVFDDSVKLYMSNVFNRDPLNTNQKSPITRSGYYRFEIKAQSNFTSAVLEFVNVRHTEPKDLSNVTRIKLSKSLKPEFSMVLSSFNLSNKLGYLIFVLLAILF